MATIRPHQWADCARDLGNALGGADRLTVFLGAGASISSGAPVTAEVEELFDGMIGRFGGYDGILSNLHRVADDDKATALARRFMDLTPFVGYRCLAVLGRSRRVLVVNMNWDPLLLAACDRLGVPCVSFDLRDAATWPDLSEMAAFTGVIDVHLHGDLADPRHGPADIRWPTNDEVELLRGLHDGARRLYVGLSLTVDHDVAYLGQQLDDGLDGRVFAFFRDDSDDPSGIVIRVSHGGEVPGVRPTSRCRLRQDHVGRHGGPCTRGRQTGRKGLHLRVPSLKEIVLPDVDAPGRRSMIAAPSW